MTALPKPIKELTHCEAEAALLGIDLDYTVRRLARQDQAGYNSSCLDAEPEVFCLHQSAVPVKPLPRLDNSANNTGAAFCVSEVGDVDY